LLLLCHFL